MMIWLTPMGKTLGLAILPSEWHCAITLNPMIGNIFLALGGSLLVTAIAFCILVWLEHRQSASK